MRYFNVLERTKFHIKLMPCKNIEDLTDSFMTQEQVDDIGGEHYMRSYGHNDEETLYLDSAILETAQEWVNMVHPGRASTTKVNGEISEMMSSIEPWRINNLLNQSRNTGIDDQWEVSRGKNGPRIRNATARRQRKYTRSQKLLQKDWKNLNRWCSWSITNVHGVHIEWCMYAHQMRENFIFTKKVLSWRKLMQLRKTSVSKYWGFHPKHIPNDDLPWLKMLWDDPDLMKQFTGQ